jgi:PAS domain S-box-containing protein
MSTSTAAALDLEIALLRERLEDAEDMRRAITSNQLDGFVVGDEPDQVVLLATAARPDQYDVARLPCVTVSRTGHILYANHHFAKLTGRGLRDLYSSPLHEVVTHDDRETMSKWLDDSEPDSTVEVMLGDDEGTGVPVRFVTVDVGHGYASLLVIDMREDQRLQEAESAVEAIARGEVDAIVVGGTRVVLVHDPNQSYQDLIDRVDQGAVSISRAGQIQHVNEPLAAMLGVPRQELLELNFFDLLGEKPARLAATIAKAATTRPMVFEVSLVRRDGSAIPAEISVSPVEGDGPVTLVVTDLTERNRHRRIEEETRRKDEFLAVLAHELRNPLASLRTCVEILNRSGGLGTNERHSVQIMGRQTDTLVRLVDDLLDIHRLNEGKIVVRRQPLALQEVVRDAIEAANPYLTSKKLAIQVAVPEQPVYANGDRVRLTQVLLNLLSNAAKFTSPGGRVAVSLETITGKVGPRARVVVTDNGCGIASDQLEKIFEPYVQVSGQSDGSIGGLGLGLSVARRLVDLHRGSIRAESDGRGTGSRFIIEIPQGQLAASETRPSVAVEGEQAQEPALRVLIVDDSRDAAESLAMLVRLAGHDVHTAYDGESALGIGRTYRPDVVFLDIGMPGIDGYTTARRIREQDWGRSVLICALTGYGQHGMESRVAGSDSRFDRRFVKPIDPGVVSRLLREAKPVQERRDANDAGGARGVPTA